MVLHVNMCIHRSLRWLQHRWCHLQAWQVWQTHWVISVNRAGGKNPSTVWRCRGNESWISDDAEWVFTSRQFQGHKSVIIQVKDFGFLGDKVNKAVVTLVCVFKGTVHPKVTFIYCHHLLTLMLFQTCVNYFFSVGHEKIFWKSVVSKQLSFIIRKKDFPKI